MGSICASGPSLQVLIPRHGRSFSNLEYELITPIKFIKQQQKDFFNDYFLDPEPIGSGIYGVIKKCIHKRSGLKYAVKEICKTGLPSSIVKNKGIYKQIQVLKEVDHPCVLRIHEFYEDCENYFMVMDYYSGGDLFEKVEENGKVPESECAIVFWQILSAISYLHEKNIIHRDIKPENIVLEDHDSDISVKIIDFDNAIYFEEPVKGMIGTLEYMAPEVLDSSYTEKCDMWSLGVLLYVLLSGNSPFGASTVEVTKLNIRKGIFDLESRVWRDISSGAKDLIRKLLQTNPQQRISATSALNHPWARSGNIYESETLSTLLRVTEFNNHNKVKEILYTYILSHIIPHENLKSLRRAFQQLDLNADGRLSRTEIFNALIKNMDQNKAEETLEIIFYNGDTDRNGSLEYSEFLRAAIQQKDLLADENIEKAFFMIDISGEGMVTYDEFQFSLGHDIPKCIMKDMLKMLDPCFTGLITLEQFKRFLLSS